MRRALLQGSFAVGQSLTIRGLASALGTSEMPVREAIKRLVAERMIVQLSNRSFQVPALEWSQFEELISLRMSIEGLAAQRAVAHSGDELLGKLTRFNETMKDALAKGDRARALRSNQEFHFALYAAAGSPILMELIETLWMRCGPYLAEAMFKIGDSRAFFGYAAELHEKLIRAVVERDEAAVFAALKDDLWSTAQWYESRIGDLRSQPPEVTPLPFHKFP